IKAASCTSTSLCSSGCEVQSRAIQTPAPKASTAAITMFFIRCSRAGIRAGLPSGARGAPGLHSVAWRRGRTRGSIEATLGFPLLESALQDQHVVPTRHTKCKAGLGRQRTGVAVDQHRSVARNGITLGQHAAPVEVVRTVDVASRKLPGVARIDDMEARQSSRGICSAKITPPPYSTKSR